MKQKELLDRKLVEKINENEFVCLKCNRKYSSGGISQHYFYNHEEDGIKKKEELRKIALEQNNDPEMRKKISRKTKEKLNEPETKEKFLKAIKSEEYREKSRKIQKELWKDKQYKEKQSKSIRDSRTEEFRKNMSKTLKVVFNKPDSPLKTKEYKNKKSKITKEQWKDKEFREKQRKSREEYWNSDRSKKQRENQSKLSKEMWKDPKHVEKVMDGKIRFLRKTGKQSSLGKIGITKNGTYYESLFEKEVFEILESNNIEFKDHIHLPDSSKMCDIVINNIWIELDGLRRDIFENSSKYGWNDKIHIYKKLKNEGTIKDYYIFRNVNEFSNWFMNWRKSNV